MLQASMSQWACQLALGRVPGDVVGSNCTMLAGMSELCMALEIGRKRPLVVCNADTRTSLLRKASWSYRRGGWRSRGADSHVSESCQ